MGRVIEINKYGRNKKGFRKGMVKPRFKFGVTFAGYVTIIIIFALSLVYLMQTNRTATYGFEVKKYDQRIEELEKERQELELEAAKLRSTNRIKENLDQLNMIEVDPTKITYYEVTRNLAKN
ncbi:MAG: hypothetical protein GF335_01455 [Candidatus Moranbacteria bacterium]|nr:hypothetical protein [Candidatus Moranbacteria bacterium]